MQKLASLLGLKTEFKKIPFIPFARKISSLKGSIRNKQTELFYTSSSKSPKRLVAQILLPSLNDIRFSATRKKLGYSLLKVLDNNIIVSHNFLLDRKIMFRSNDQSFADKVFKYEETCDKLDALFSYKFNNGILTVGQSSIFYYENIGFLTKNRRERFRIAIDLMCDLFDILYFHKKQIT